MIELRPIRENEALSVFALENVIWPNSICATEEQLLTRLKTFPDGVIGVWINNIPVGYATTQIIKYNETADSSDLEQFLPRRGELGRHDNHGNCLHFISCGIVPRYRRKGLWNCLIEYRFALANVLGLKYVLVDSRQPSFSKRPDAWKNVQANEYASIRQGDRCIDPLIANFQSVGFRFLCSVRSGYPDPESGDYWVFMVKKM